MLAALEQYLIPQLEALYRAIGYVGVMLAMAIESACIPLPSEIVLPLAGWMVARGEWNLVPAVVAATVGNTLGSIVAYWVGALGGRPILLRYGKYVLLSAHEVDIADRWFAKYGEWAVFFSRMLPVVRTFISFPAGVARMNFARFILYSTLGALPWSLALIYAGKLLGENWIVVRESLHGVDYFIAAIILVLVGYFVYHKVSSRKPVGSLEE